MKNAFKLNSQSPLSQTLNQYKLYHPYISTITPATCKTWEEKRTDFPSVQNVNVVEHSHSNPCRSNHFSPQSNPGWPLRRLPSLFHTHSQWDIHKITPAWLTCATKNNDVNETAFDHFTPFQSTLTPFPFSLPLSLILLIWFMVYQLSEVTQRRACLQMRYWSRWRFN